MQIAYYGRRGKYVAETVKKLCAPKANLVRCDSFEHVLERVTEQGGDPFRIGVIPVLQERSSDYKTVAIINNLHLVSNTYMPLQISVPAQKARSALIRAYSTS